ncbi:MAG: type 4a pilus biogenesis protein PilO [Proteobacteria bacterium]|nr:type 4a pilus biogenesis protein PilO [Pseudomonadota bacterium]
MDMNDLKNFNVNDLDVNNMGSWPAPVKAIVLLIAFIAVLAAGYKFMITDQLTTLEQKEQEEQELRVSFSNKQARAANLDAYKAQLEDMRRSFGAMLRQLPGKTEIDALLIDISQAGLGAGLQQELFAPQNETVREFYAEVPIQIRLSGNFHQFGEFASAVAALPRIVTLHDISIGRRGEGLRMDVVAKTYRYMDDEEAAGNTRKGAKR